MQTRVTLKTTLKAHQAKLTAHFKQGFLQPSQLVAQFNFDSDDAFYLAINDAELALEAGLHSAPTINLYLDSHATCWALLEGQLDGMEAFMAGRYRADGNIVLSQLLLYAFRETHPLIAYEVQD